jgi:hypothetical protein
LEEFNDVPPKHIWTSEVKKGMTSVVIGNNMPFVPHLSLCGCGSPWS